MSERRSKELVCQHIHSHKPHPTTVPLTFSNALLLESKGEEGLGICG